MTDAAYSTATPLWAAHRGSSVATSPVPAEAARTEERSTIAGEALGATVAAILALGAAVVFLQLWRAAFGVPFVNQGDGLLSQLVVNDVLNHGWYFTSKLLGAPFGQELYDYPVANGNNLDLLLIKPLGLVTHDVAVALNTFFIASFALIAISAYAAFRWVGARRQSAVVCAVLYALLPYHLLRGETELFLAAYFSVPLAAALLLALLTRKPVFDGAGRARLPRPGRRTLTTLLLCVVIGSSGTYYAVFAALLTVVVAVLLFAAHRRLADVVPALCITSAIVLTLAANMAPTFVYRIHHGSDPAVAQRLPQQSESDGLSLTGLLLPTEAHRLAPFARVRARYATTTAISGEQTQSLGIVGGLGFLLLLTMLLRAPLTRRRPGPNARLLLSAGTLATATLILGTVGGGSALIAYLVSPSIHAWNRISVFIAFFGLVGVAFFLDASARKLRRRPFRVVTVGTLLAGTLVLGALDQTSRANVPQYEQVAFSYRSDAAFVRELESRLPSHAALFQLPYMSFPEAAGAAADDGRPKGFMRDYDPLRLPLLSRGLRWSYGAMRGRPADWAQHVADAPAPALVAAVAAAGFSGVVVDQFGYPGHGRELLGRLAAVAHTTPVYSPDRRYAFVDTREYATRMTDERLPDTLATLRLATLSPLRVTWSGGFWPVESDGRDTWRWTNGRQGMLQIFNWTPSVRTILFRIGVATGSTAGKPNVLVVYPDGTRQWITADASGTVVQGKALIPPGTSAIRFSTVSAPAKPAPGDPRSALYLRLSQVTVSDASFDAVAADPTLRPLLQIPVSTEALR